MKNLFLSALVLLLFVGGCASSKSKTGSKTFDLTSTSWQLEQLNGEAVAISGDSFTLIFNAENQLGGKGSCNLLIGSYKADKKGAIRFAPLGLTRTACPDMQSEMAYVKMLDEVRSYAVLDNTLVLSAGDDVVARFKLK